MPSRKWNPSLLPRDRFDEYAKMIIGPYADNARRSVIVQILYGLANEQAKMTVQAGVNRALKKRGLTPHSQVKPSNEPPPPNPVMREKLRGSKERLLATAKRLGLIQR